MVPQECRVSGKVPGDFPMAEPQRNAGDINAGVQHMHGKDMSSQVRTYP
jgi:hypothetical protein